MNWNSLPTFMVNSMTKIEPTLESMRKRANNFAYYLTVNDRKRYVYTAWDKLAELGIVGPGNRGKHSNHRKTDEVIFKGFRSHIKSFPCTGSIKKDEPQQTKYVLRNTFTHEIFTPKKDQCVFGMQYNNASHEEKVHLEGRYQNHIKNKQISREIKRADV
ncbi:hypothetical protein PR048_006813 [Dryococelus australis]|uniref:Uncharacterized protein n=1 Tax=Dryococelus australis TaxID=614101 RepID=A0ABQ9IE74_9NEOP|nr:hypothetical protein PR048_006813 [Dryococelus australis]